MNVYCDRAAHTYTLDGVLAPSVTDIIDAVHPLVIPEWARASFEWKGILGSAVHALIAADLLGRPTPIHDFEPAVAHAASRYFQSFLAARSALAWGEVEAIEVIVASARLWFAGTLDAMIQARPGRVLCDWKTWATWDAVRARRQIGGYVVGWEESHPELPVDECWGFHLGRDGEWKLHRYEPHVCRAEFLDDCLQPYKERSR